jgi:hypothetical protein
LVFNSHKEAQKAQEEMFLFCASCASLWLLKPNDYFEQKETEATKVKQRRYVK